MGVYNLLNWKDRIVQFPMRFRDNSNNQVTLTGDPGTITQPGTPLNATNLAYMDAGIKEAYDRTNDYKVYKSSKDANGFFPVAEWKRNDLTLYRNSVLSNPDSNGNYQTQVIKYYAENGTTLLKTQTWTLAYDSDGDLVSEVLVSEV